jgi:hypothetical protein
LSPLTSVEVTPIIIELARKKKYRISPHAYKRIKQPDRNFTEEKMLFILKFPKTVSEPEWDETHREYKYIVQGHNKRHVVLNVRSKYLHIVTVY